MENFVTALQELYPDWRGRVEKLANGHLKVLNENPEIEIDEDAVKARANELAAAYEAQRRLSELDVEVIPYLIRAVEDLAEAAGITLGDEYKWHQIIKEQKTLRETVSQ